MRRLLSRPMRISQKQLEWCSDISIKIDNLFTKDNAAPIMRQMVLQRLLDFEQLKLALNLYNDLHKG